MTAIGLPARAPCDRCGGDHLECHAPVLNDRELCEGAQGILAKARAIVAYASAGKHSELRRALLDLEEDAGSLALEIPR